MTSTSSSKTSFFAESASRHRRLPLLVKGSAVSPTPRFLGVEYSTIPVNDETGGQRSTTFLVNGDNRVRHDEVMVTCLFFISQKMWLAKVLQRATLRAVRRSVCIISRTGCDEHTHFKTAVWYLVAVWYRTTPTVASPWMVDDLCLFCELHYITINNLSHQQHTRE